MNDTANAINALWDIHILPKFKELNEKIENLQKRVENLEQVLAAGMKGNTR